MASRFVSLAISFLTLLTFSNAAPSFTPIQPPSYPLAVRNPYLSAWMPGPLAGSLPSTSPQFWAGQNLTWSVIAKVDGKTYSLMGVPSPGSGVEAASVSSGVYTSTRTTFTLDAGSATIALDFLSPVSPKNYVRQSFPFSYLTVAVTGSAKSVQIYSDIDGTWTGHGANASSSTYTIANSGSTTIYTWSSTGAATYSEANDQALWGQPVYATRPSGSSKVSSASGQPGTLRSQFASNGSLSGVQANYAGGSVTAFAQDLGSGSGNVTFAIGYVREQAVNYLGAARTGYYRSKYSDIPSAVNAFLDDYDGADSDAQALDAALESKASTAGGSNYSDILALSVRQTYGSLDLTIPGDSLSTDDVLVFLKEISSDGNVNSVDVIFPAFPILYVLDAEWIRLVCEPVMSYLATGRWPYNYAIHDIGSAYPNATGHDDGNAEQMPIEESGNLLILAYAYQKATGKTDWTTKYSALFKEYANYLVANGTYPANQLSTDDFAGPAANQTNLAIKAAIALSAYGTMTDQANYTSAGAKMSNTIYTDGVGTDSNKTHFALTYDNKTEWITTYNLYPQKLLDLDTFPQSAFDMQNKFYPNLRQAYGVPLDNRLPYAKSDWMMFNAAYGDSTTTPMFVSDLHKFITDGENGVPFSDRYTVADGKYDGFIARPVVGGHFAILALEGGANQFDSGVISKVRSRRVRRDPTGGTLSYY